MPDSKSDMTRRQTILECLRAEGMSDHDIKAIMPGAILSSETREGANAMTQTPSAPLLVVTIILMFPLWLIIELWIKVISRCRFIYMHGVEELAAARKTWQTGRVERS